MDRSRKSSAFNSMLGKSRSLSSTMSSGVPQLPAIVLGVGTSQRRKKILTKRVNPDWYKRYADILPEHERVSLQPLREIKAEEAMIKAMETPPKARDRTEELARKLALERANKIKTVLRILEGDPAKMKQTLASVNQSTTSPFKYLTREEAEEERKNRAKGYSCKLLLPDGWRLSPTSKWRLLRANKIIQKKLRTMAEELKAKKIRARWQKAIRIVRAVVRFTSIIANIARTTGDVFKEFHEVMKKNRQDDSSSAGLCFDRSYYRASAMGQKQLDNESMFTLCKPEIYRTPAEIHRAAVSLRSLRSFAAFPAHYQDMMATIGWILDVPSDKVIIRQGQEAHAFYFLLSGKAVAVRLTPTGSFMRNTGFDVLNLYERDGMFGEEGVIDRGYRTYSVTSIENCTLLSVNIDDYNRLCLTAPSEDDNPDHIRLLSQLEFMRFFPMKKLIDDADGNIVVFYFKPGSVVTPKLSESNYIYIIKSGTCRALCQVVRKKKTKRTTLKIVVPPINRDREVKEAESFKPLTIHEDEEEQEQDDAVESELKLEVDRPSNDQSSEDENTDKDETKATGTQQPQPSPAPSVLSIESQGPSTGPKKQLPPSEDDSDGDGMSVRASRTMKLMEKLKTQWEQEDSIATSIRKMKGRVNPWGMTLQKAGSIEKFLSAPGAKTKRTDCGTSTIWVNLRTLREADVIGIEELDLADERDDHQTVAVVSDGSEVILVSRKYFMDNASPKMRAHLRSRSYLLPDEAMLTQELIRLQFWRQFRNQTMKDIR